MIRVVLIGLLACGFGFACWVGYRLEMRRLQEERDAFEARKAAAREHLRADALRRHEEMLRVFERGSHHVTAAHRGSQK